MNIKELIQILKRHDENMNVVCTWETVITEIEDDCIYKAQDHLVIDADWNSYKNEFIEGTLKIKKELYD